MSTDSNGNGVVNHLDLAVFSENFGATGAGSEDGDADVDNAGGLSPFGTMAQGGNAWEWEESASDLTNDVTDEIRLVRGGLWTIDASFLRSTSFVSIIPDIVGDPGLIGIRIVSIPEPSSALLLSLSIVVISKMSRVRK